MIFNYESPELISINILELVKRQRKINDKFPNPNRNSKYINVYDNMVGQISEEVFETKESINKNKEMPLPIKVQTNDSLEEFIDVLMYTGSLLIETATYFEIDIIDFLKHNDDYAYIHIYDTYKDNDFKEENRNIPTCENLIYTRRKIIDRKYHKPAKERPENYEINLIKSIIVGTFLPRKNDKDNNEDIYEEFKIPEFITNMNPYIQDVLFCYDDELNFSLARKYLIEDRINLLNELFENKNNKIANL